LDLLGYTELFNQIASYGFVVAATFSCNTGCTDRKPSKYTACGGMLPLSPIGMGWDVYYGELFKMVEWTQEQSQNISSDAVFHQIDQSVGVGIAGHSMGGQAAAVAASAACAKQWNVKASVLHHPASGQLPSGANIGVNISMPIGGFSSSGDSIWPELEQIMNASSFTPALYRYEEGWSHLEPVLWPPCENPLLATYTAAFFKIYLGGDPNGSFYDMIYGNGPDSICNSAPQVKCWAKK
jgi:hypothetical protein